MRTTRNHLKLLFTLALCFLFGSAGAQQKNLLYFDATANFERFATKDSIRYYLQKSKDAGVTDVIIDIKPISGEVLYPSKIAPVMQEWRGFRKKDHTDLLATFLREGHQMGLRVHATINIFSGGHNAFKRGIVFSDPKKSDWQSLNYTPAGLTRISEIKNKWSAMINPANPQVQQYELSIIMELASMYPGLDGIILDRVRYDSIESDFSPLSKNLFESYAGIKVQNFPEDIFSYDQNKKRIPGVHYKKWIEWRAKVIHDFFYAARKALKSKYPKIQFGDYTGSWYPTYYEVGVNWASKDYDPAQQFDWATADYKNFGYAEALDLYTTGSYYFEVEKKEAQHIDLTKVSRIEAGQGKGKEDWYTVEGSAEMAMKLMKGKVPVYAGIYVEQYQKNASQFIKALKMCRKKSNGVMVFDIVHVIEKNWWKELKEGLND